LSCLTIRHSFNDSARGNPLLDKAFDRLEKIVRDVAVVRLRVPREEKPVCLAHLGK
jgi:hypothetical protein